MLLFITKGSAKLEMSENKKCQQNNLPLGAEYCKHRPELDAPGNINKALHGESRTLLNNKQPSERGVAGHKQTVGHQGTIPPEDLIPIYAYVQNNAYVNPSVEVSSILTELKKFYELLDYERQLRDSEKFEKTHRQKAANPTVSIP